MEKYWPQLSLEASLELVELPTPTGTFLLGRGTSRQSCISGTPGLGLPNINTQAGHAGLICQTGNRSQVGFINSSPTSSLRQDLDSGLGTSWWHFLHTDVSEVFVQNQTVTRPHGG